MTEEELFLKELQDGFMEEALDLVEQCEQYSLQLESGNDTKECIEVLFRNFHAIKGTAAPVDMQDLAGYTHKVENLLVALKNEELNVDPPIVSLLLEASDTTKRYTLNKKEGEDCNINQVDIENKVSSILGKSNVDKLKDKEDIKKLEEMLDASTTDIAKDSPRNLGEILLDSEKITVDQLGDALEEQGRKLGTVMIEKGDITQDDLRNALGVQDKERKHVSQKAEEYIKLPLSKIDGLIDYLGEQVILQTALNYCKEKSSNSDELMDKTIVQLNKITQDLQQSAISLRMFNLKPVFMKAKRLVRDVSLQVKRDVRFVGIGENTELDKTIVDELSGPITHLVRNSVDHGIEDEEARITNGKEPFGTVELQAFQKSGFFYLVISDDGKGLDVEKIRDKAIKFGIINAETNVTDEQLYNYIFSSGFSTKDKATDISGRGVGMGVVKTAIEKLRGTIKVKSKKGEDSSFIIKLPLSLAIFNGMIVDISGKKFIIPNSEISQIIEKQDENKYSIDAKNDLLRDGESVYPIVNLENIIGIRPSKKKIDKSGKKHVLYLIASCERSKYAIKINDIIGQQKIVLKELPENLSSLKGVSGVTILGDGSASLILDVNKALTIYRGAAQVNK